MLKLGSVWKNKDPYESEGELIIGKPFKPFGEGFYRCVRVRNTRHPWLNDTVRILNEETIRKSFIKISD